MNNFEFILKLRRSPNCRDADKILVSFYEDHWDPGTEDPVRLHLMSAIVSDKRFPINPLVEAF